MSEFDLETQIRALPPIVNRSVLRALLARAPEAAHAPFVGLLMESLSSTMSSGLSGLPRLVDGDAEVTALAQQLFTGPSSHETPER